jgi:hypothetical protein
MLTDDTEPVMSSPFASYLASGTAEVNSGVRAQILVGKEIGRFT